ncbi:MAG: DUF1861 family protein [Streptococcaceae bacterium]|jgi:hypothetical protein|nr:DUF1861 family protein [Streptococcaceae bacterium]
MEVKELLEAHRLDKSPRQAEKLIFEGVDGFDVYNISAPFEFSGLKIIAGRVEKTDSEDSRICFFSEADTEKSAGFWRLIEEASQLKLQDPFTFTVNQQRFIGGVEVIFAEKVDEKTTWRTIVYKMESLSAFERIFEGPWGMKDLRFKQIPDGSILVLTRPQNENKKKGGRGKIGLVHLKSFSDLSLEVIDKALLLENQFIDAEWGGANEIHFIDGRIWILGHIANFDRAGNRHYYSALYLLSEDRKSIQFSKIIAERKDFKDGKSKRSDLIDVVFSGGLILDGKYAVIYVGTSDAEAQSLKILNPFIK